MKPFVPTLALLAFCCTAPSYASIACEVKSGAATAALVELYTSEGCSSCPPADQALSQLRRRLPAGAVLVPLALHVGYWNQLGWADPYAQATFDQRQQRLLEGKAHHVVYTPQFFVNGEELRDWPQALPAAIQRMNATPAPLAITLSARPADAGAVTLEAQASAADGRTAGQLYVALTESGLASHVLRGENGGATLHHDDTARLWLGPVALRAGQATLRQRVTLPAGWRRERLQAVALVQADNDGAVLQAVSTAQCDGRVL